MKYNLKYKNLQIAVRCDDYKEMLQVCEIYTQAYPDSKHLSDWSESQPFFCISPKHLPAQFVNHYYAKENGLEVVQFSDFLRDNSLEAEAKPISSSSGDGTGQQQSADEFKLVIKPQPVSREFRDVLVNMGCNISNIGANEILSFSVGPDMPMPIFSYNPYKIPARDNELVKSYEEAKEKNKNRTRAFSILSELLKCKEEDTPPEVGLWTELTDLVQGRFAIIKTPTKTAK